MMEQEARGTSVVPAEDRAGQSKMRLSYASLIFPLVCGVAVGVLAADRAFTSYASVKPVLDQPGDLLPAELRNPNEAKWSAWSQRQDKAIRARLQQGDLDSMVNLLLYGTSFTKQPRIKVEAFTEASKAGILRARVDDLVAGLRSPGDNERLTFLNGLLRSQGIDPNSPGETGVFIYNNLGRVLQEMETLAKRAEEAKRLIQPAQPDAVSDPAAIFNWRPGLFRDRGVSLDTGIFPNFSIEQALRDLKNRGVLREGQVARVAVIGPGLDFSDKNENASYDYYPQQTLQPFALYDSLVRLGLARANAVSMSIFDISPRVIDHIQRARERARIEHRLCHPVAARGRASVAARSHRLLAFAGRPRGNRGCADHSSQCVSRLGNASGANPSGRGAQPVSRWTSISFSNASIWPRRTDST